MCAPHRRLVPRAWPHPPGAHIALVALAALVGWASLPPPSADAASRLVRRYDERDGLKVTEIVELAQDERGFLWIGTVGGIVRFDGATMRTWSPESLTHVARVIACSPAGEVVVAGLGEPLRAITEDGVRPVAGPRGAGITNWTDAAFAADGALWVATPDTLWRRDARGAWRSWSASAFESGAFGLVRRDRGGAVFVGTDGALWALESAGAPVRMASIGGAAYAQRGADGRVIVLTRGGKLHAIREGRDTLLYAGEGHGRGLAVRGDVVWASIDQYILAFAPGRRAEVVAPGPGMPTGRPIVVDHEGSLWVGGFSSLLELPEPGTLVWDEHDGLPSPAHMHDLARTPAGVWALSWYGAVRLPADDPDARPVPIGRFAGTPAVDALGRVWTGEPGRGFVRWDGVRATRFSRPSLHGVYAASPRRDGTTWLATEDGLFRVPRGGGAPERTRSPAPAAFASGWEECGMTTVIEDAGGRLWFAAGEDVWSAPADPVARGEAVAWRRDPIPGSDGGTAFIQSADGALWLGTANAGVLRHSAGGWEAVPGNRELASLRVYNMRPSPSGGFWVLAPGSLVRVRSDAHAAGGWRIVERLNGWQGIPTQQAGDIAEDADGTLWLATLSGLIRVPPDARRARRAPPRVVLVDLLEDGRALPLGRDVRLPWRSNRIELRFAALSYRDRSMLRYQVRLRSADAWRDCAEPTFRFADLRPGRYAAELRASLDGAHWTEPPTRIAFRVDRPWYLEWWAIALFVAALAAALLAAHRVRVAFLLRLERQRTSIAMDLHDEMGSGLGSIGILAGLAAEGRLDDEARRGLARRIAATASELGGALSDIVQSLQREKDTLQAFALGLVERGRRLMPGDSPALLVRLPERWPLVRLEPETRRELTLIAVEALHNAARHSGARQVELTLDGDGGHWSLRIADDGCGLPPAGGNGASHGGNGDGAARGNGLRNMRARARGLGARIEWMAAPGGGTIVELRFDPRRRPARAGVA